MKLMTLYTVTCLKTVNRVDNLLKAYMMDGEGDESIATTVSPLKFPNGAQFEAAPDFDFAQTNSYNNTQISSF